MFYYTVYKITNIINGKYYVGCHKTKDLNDGYMGSGKLIKRALQKYGVENFKKEYIEIFDNKESMFKLEKDIVNNDYLENPLSYNLKNGGKGGFDHLVSWVRSEENITRLKNLTKTEDWKNISKKGCEKMKELLQDKNSDWCLNHSRKISEGRLRYFNNGGKGSFTGKKHTDESKNLMSLSKEGLYDGDKNPQYGKQWIYNIDLKCNKIVYKEESVEYIKNGWFVGRKMKF